MHLPESNASELLRELAHSVFFDVQTLRRIELGKLLGDIRRRADASRDQTDELPARPQHTERLP